MKVRLRKISAISLTMKATICLALVGLSSASLLARNGDEIQNAASHDNGNEYGKSVPSVGMFRKVSRRHRKKENGNGNGKDSSFCCSAILKLTYLPYHFQSILAYLQLLLEWSGYVNNENDTYNGEEYDDDEYNDDNDDDNDDDDNDEEDDDEIDNASTYEDVLANDEDNKIVLTDFFLKEENRELRPRVKSSTGKVGPKKSKAETKSNDLRGCLKVALETFERVLPPGPKESAKHTDADEKKSRKMKEKPPRRQLLDENNHDEATSASEMERFIHGYVNNQDNYDSFYNYGEYYEFSRGLQQCDDITQYTQNLVSKKHFHNDAKIARGESISSVLWLQL